MRIGIGLGLAALMLPGVAFAQNPAPAETVTVEYYYKIKWGSAAEFNELYKRNHAPILKEMQRLGFITAIRSEEPFTHMAGDQRWDKRVTITFRDAATAVVPGGAYDKASEPVVARLYPDKAKFEREEAKRFSLLEEHWDVIVVSSGE